MRAGAFKAVIDVVFLLEIRHKRRYDPVPGVVKEEPDHIKIFHDRTYPIAEEIHRTIISLPMSPVLTDDEVKQVTEIVNAYR